MSGEWVRQSGFFELLSDKFGFWSEKFARQRLSGAAEGDVPEGGTGM